MNLAFAGCLDGWIYAQMLITTTGNTGRRIIIPLKPKSKHRFRKYIIRTMELTAIGVWKSIWSVKVILTVIPPFINIWTQSLVSVRLSVKKPGYEHGNPHKVFDNKLKQNFTADEINRKWCTDFTYLFLANHEVRYNCTIIDLHDRSVIASITDRNITSDLAIRTLRKALESQPTIKDGLILHSDQGSQYTSKAFTEFCESVNVTQSMSKAGYPYDNAPMERYFNTLKNECTNLYEFTTEETLYQKVEEFAYVDYNHVRPHSYNGYRTPYEARTAA